NRDVVGFALDDDERRLGVTLVRHYAPNDDVSLSGLASALGGGFFVHLREVKAVVIDESADELLSDDFLRELDEPTLADVTPDFSLAVAAKGEWGFGLCVRHGWRITGWILLARFLPPFQGLEFSFDNLPRASLADSLCPGLSSVGPAAL